jgi:tetratricopeptide (TPR) repeat protein
MRRPSAPWIVLLVALALRFAVVLETRDTVRFESPLVDAKTYDDSARAIAAHGPGALELPYYQPPLYPMLLGAVYAASGGSYLAPRVLQALLGAVTAMLVFWIAARMSGRRAGWIGSLAFVAYGPALYFEGELLPPALILAANTGALALLLRADETGRTTPWLLAAFLLGVSTAARPTALLLAMAAAVWWLRRPERPAGATRSPALLPAMLVFLLPVLPFTLANSIGGKEPVLVSWNGGINFYLGNGADSDSLAAIRPGHAWDRLQVEPLRGGARSRREESRYWVRRAFEEASADPAEWATALGRKALRLLDAREAPRNTDWEYWRRDSTILSLPWIGFGILAPLAFLGLGVRGVSPRTRSLLALSLAVTAAVNLLFFVAGRYRLEAVPALCVLAGVAVDRVCRDGRRAVSIPAFVAVALVAIVVHVDFLGERSIDEARAAINRGAALRQLGLDASAARAYREAVAAAPDDPDAHYHLGQIALAEKNPARALSSFERSLAGAPDYVKALLARATCLERLHRREEAEESYLRAIAADPWAVETRLNYGVFLAIGGRTEEARRAFEAGLAIDPTDGRLQRNLRRLLNGS